MNFLEGTHAIKQLSPTCAVDRDISILADNPSNRRREVLDKYRTDGFISVHMYTYTTHTQFKQIDVN